MKIEQDEQPNVSLGEIQYRKFEEKSGKCFIVPHPKAFWYFKLH